MPVIAITFDRSAQGESEQTVVEAEGTFEQLGPIIGQLLVKEAVDHPFTYALIEMHEPAEKVDV